MWKMKKKVVDERIERESNQAIAKQFYVMLSLIILLVIVKLFFKLPFYMYLLELSTFAVMVLYVLLKEGLQGILFVKGKDESLQALHASILVKAYYLGLIMIIGGELFYAFFLTTYKKEYFFWDAFYFLIWVPSALWITILSIKKGWLIWGTKKKETEGKKNFGVRTVIGSIIFGGIMLLFKVLETGDLQLEDIESVVLMVVTWGLLFYLMMTFFMKMSEKKANQLVEEESSEIKSDEE